jgi:hypothetical protein
MTNQRMKSLDVHMSSSSISRSRVSIEYNEIIYDVIISATAAAQQGGSGRYQETNHKLKLCYADVFKECKLNLNKLTLYY